MGSLMSCLKGHDEGIEDDHSGNENSTHNQRYYLLRKCTSLFGPMRSIGFSSNQEPPSSSPNEAAENSESNTAPASPLLLSFPPAANSSHSYSEIVRTAIQQGGSLDYKEKPKKSKDDSSLSLDECPTCLEEYSDENPKIIAKCSHHYHLGCIYDWMERSTTCPICRKLMVFDEGAWHI